MDRVERSQNRTPDTVTEMNFGLRFAENGASRVTRQTWTTVNVSENCYNLAETCCIREYGIKIFTCYRQVRHPRLFQACGYRLVTHSIHYTLIAS